MDRTIEKRICIILRVVPRGEWITGEFFGGLFKFFVCRSCYLMDIVIYVAQR